MASTISAGTTSGTAIAIAGDTTGALALQTNNGTTAVTISTAQSTTLNSAASTAPLITQINGTEALRVDSSGNLIGNALTSSVFSMGVNTAGKDVRLGVLSGGNGRVEFYSAGAEAMRIDTGGNIVMNGGLIYTSNNQNIRFPSTGGYGYVGNTTSASAFQISYNSTGAGVQLTSGATSWGTFSDSRLKNVTGTYTTALADISQLQPVKFTWKSDAENKPQVGVIAQSVKNVVPEAVESCTIEMDGTEEYLTVRYTELIPLMIASIQELNAKVDAQAAEIQALKGVA